MTTVTKDQLKIMLDSVDPKVDKQKVLETMLSQGLVVKDVNEPKPEQTGGLFGGITDFAKGAIKSVGNTANNINRMAEPVMNVIDAPLGKVAQAITGRTNQEQLQNIQAHQQNIASDMATREGLAQTHNPAQELGKVAGDIAQFVVQPEAKGGAIVRPATNFVTGFGTSAAQGGDVTQNVIAGGLNALAPEVSNIATAVKGVKDAKKAQALIDLVSPRLTPSVAAETKVTNPTGLLGKIEEITPQRVKDIAAAVSDIVKPAKTFTENKNLVQKAISTEAENLKGTLESIKYDGASLKSILKKDVGNIEIPELIKTGDKTVKNQAKAIVTKLQAIIDKTVSETDAHLGQGLEARKLFDNYVQKEFPKAFDDVANARNILIKNARTALNQTLDTLAQNKTVSKSLKLQNLMYEALDTIAEKVAKGELRKAGEIGSNVVTRLAGKNPKTAKALKYVGATVGGAAIGGGAYNALKDVVGN